MKLYNDQYVVVTGGAGFIGSGVVAALNERGFDKIIVIDDLGTSEKWKNLVGKNFDELLSVDKTFHWLSDRQNEVQAIIHLGANSDTTEIDASFLLENNTHFTQQLCSWAQLHQARFIYASSAATYGDGSLGFSDREENLENLRPLNMYGYSKHLFDLWAKKNGLFDTIVGLKYFNVFGPNEGHKGRMASVVAKFKTQIERERKVFLFQSNDPENYGDGQQCRDFIYVKDAVKITLAFLENEVSGLFNVGSGRAETWNQLAQATFKAMRLDTCIEYIPMPEDLLGKYQNYTKADVTKLEGALGPLSVAMPLEAAVEDYLQNYLLPKQSW